VTRSEKRISPAPVKLNKAIQSIPYGERARAQNYLLFSSVGRIPFFLAFAIKMEIEAHRSVSAFDLIQHQRLLSKHEDNR